MLDQKKIGKRVLLSLLASPWTLWPAMVGSTLLLGNWALGSPSGGAMWGGLTCLFGAVTAFLARTATKADGLRKDTIEKMQAQAMSERNRELDELEENLERDGDKRTEILLQDLRAIATAFNEGKGQSSILNADFAFDIAYNVEQLFKNSVKSIERAYLLAGTAKKLRTDEARAPLLEQKERILEEVQKSVSQLGKILARVQTLGLGEQGPAELKRLREELDESVEMAHRVEEQVREVDIQLGSAP